MTCDERLEALLNRAGQTISDLPKREGTEASEPYPLSALPKSNGVAWNWYLDIGTDMDDYDSTRSKMVLKLYILHLTDIIDRMEIALENVIGERDYLRSRFHCFFCKHYDDMTTTEPCKSCLLSNGDPGFELDYDKSIVPEDWRADDADI